MRGGAKQVQRFVKRILKSGEEACGGLHVVIEQQDSLMPHSLQPGVDGLGEGEGLFGLHNFDLRKLSLQPFSGSIGGPVIDDDHLRWELFQ